MPIITLTTDLGNRDSYVPTVKGYLLGAAPEANILDITHQIAPFNITEAGYILGNCYKDFPAGSIHLISVDANTRMAERFIMVSADNYWFIARDNGLIPLTVPQSEIKSIFELSFDKKDLIFPLRFILAKAAAHLAQGTAPEIIGEPTHEILKLNHQQPVFNGTMLRGVVQYIDNIGNAISNISCDRLEEIGNGRKFRIYITRSEYFEEIFSSYNQVEEGEKVCIFNSAGRLEIAINKGSASGLLGLHTGSQILVEYI